MPSEREQELKPCPFCGKSAEVVCRHNSPAGEAWAIVHSGNWGCPVHFDRSFNSETEAIAAWNTRPTEAAAEARGMAEIERLREVIRRYQNVHGVLTDSDRQYLKAALNGGQHE